MADPLHRVRKNFDVSKFLIIYQNKYISSLSLLFLKSINNSDIKNIYITHNISKLANNR